MSCCFSSTAELPVTTGVFTSDGPFNAVITANPVLDSNSANISTNQVGRVHVMGIYDYGVPIYDADAGMTKYVVNVINSPDWGPNAFSTYPCPLTSNMAPSPGTDGALCVVDWVTRRSYEFWQYSWNGGSPRCSWGAVFSLDSDGVDPLVPGAIGPIGAGFSRLAGIGRMSELTAGLIPHPLVFSSGMSGSGWLYPAVKSDGGAGGNVFKEGHRIQLNPTANIDSLTGVTRTIAQALKTYGAYCMDVGGTGLNFIFETPHPGGPDPYPGLGVVGDYFNLSAIPWSSIRVLNTWNGV